MFILGTTFMAVSFMQYLLFWLFCYPGSNYWYQKQLGSFINFQEKPTQSVEIHLHFYLISLNALSPFLNLFHYLLSGWTPMEHLMPF